MNSIHIPRSRWLPLGSSSGLNQTSRLVRRNGERSISKRRLNSLVRCHWMISWSSSAIRRYKSLSCSTSGVSARRVNAGMRSCSSSSIRPMSVLTPVGPWRITIPSSAKCARRALINIVRWRTSSSRARRNINTLCCDDDLAHIVLPLLDAWKGLRARAADLGRQLVADARQSQACRILMSIPGVGAITATSFAAAIEEPENFRKSRSVGAWIGLTTRRY